MVLMDPFQLRTFHDSLFFWSHTMLSPLVIFKGLLNLFKGFLNPQIFQGFCKAVSETQGSVVELGMSVKAQAVQSFQVLYPPLCMFSLTLELWCSHHRALSDNCSTLGFPYLISPFGKSWGTRWLNGHCLLQAWEGHQDMCPHSWPGRLTWTHHTKSLGSHKTQSDSSCFRNDFQPPRRSLVPLFTSARAEVVYSRRKSPQEPQGRHWSPLSR